MKHDPSSLSPDIRARSFVASNGELGLHIADVPAYVDCCDDDGVPVLGWEAWIINHLRTGEFSLGSWSGLIPKQDGTSAIIGGDGDADDVKRQCASFRSEIEVSLQWLPHFRINITVGAK